MSACSRMLSGDRKIGSSHKPEVLRDGV